MYYAWSEPGVILPPKSATASRQGGGGKGGRGGGLETEEGVGGGRRGRKERGGKGREFAPGCRFKTLAQISRLQSRWAGGGGGEGRLSGAGGAGGKRKERRVVAPGCYSLRHWGCFTLSLLNQPSSVWTEEEGVDVDTAVFINPPRLTKIFSLDRGRRKKVSA